MVFQVLRDGSVLIIERKGVLKLYEAASKTTKVVAKIPVNTKYTNAAGAPREAEEGLVGLTLDPGFEKNHWIYMLYADPQVAKHSLARWTLEETKDADGQRTMALVEGSKKVMLEYRRPARAVLPHGRRHGVGQGRQPLHDGRQQYVQLARHAVGRASRPPAVGRPARRREHQRPAREDHPHPSGAGRHLHDPEGQSLSARHREHAAGDLHHGKPQPVAREHRQQDRLHLLGRGRPRRQRRYAAGAARLRRAQPGEGAGLLRLAVLRRREQGLPVFRLRGEQADGAEGSGQADQRLGEQHRPARAPAGAAGVHLVSLRAVREVPRGRQRRALRQRRADLSPRGLSRRQAAVPGVLRGHVVHLRLLARVDHGGHARRAVELRLDGALPARPQAGRADRREVRPRRRSLRARLRQHLVRQEPGRIAGSASSTTAATGRRRRTITSDRTGGTTPFKIALSSNGTPRLRRRPAEIRVDDRGGGWQQAARLHPGEPDGGVRQGRHLRRDAHRQRSGRRQGHRLARHHRRQRPAGGRDRGRRRQQELLHAEDADSVLGHRRRSRGRQRRRQEDRP